MQDKGLTDKSRLNKTELAILIGAAVVTMTLASTCSPLYPFNPWDDANCFFTLGRGITHGLVPYRDLYEQKGPLLYFIYAFAAFLSDRSFIGAWIAECVMASLFAVFSWKIAKLFTEPPKYAVVLVPLLTGLTYTSRLFNFGGNAEELCFPLLTVALYFGLRAIVNGNGLPSKRDALICGIITAALFWIKYTFIGFMAGFCLYILVMAIKQKAFAHLWSLIWRFFAGFLILTAPILIYFIANGALGSLWEVYFYNNIFLYHELEGNAALSKIPVIRNIYIPSFILTIGLIFTKSAFIYYYVYLLACFFALLLIPCIKGLNYISKYFKQNPGFMKGLISGVLIVFYLAALLLNKNNYLLFQKKDFFAQYRYAEIINQVPDAKVLTYDVMDSGFYTAAGILPSNRYFCYLNIELTYPAILEEQNRLIEAGYFDFIVTSYFCECDWDNYVLIREEADTYINYSGKKALDGFRLYKRI